MRLIGLGISEGESSRDLAVHREMPEQLACPVDVGVGVALLLITLGQLPEGIMRERVLRHQFQKISSLAVVTTLIVAVGQFGPRFYGISHREGLLVILLRLEGVILLHATVAHLQQHLQGVQTLAPSGEYRQQGEDEHSE